MFTTIDKSEIVALHNKAGQLIALCRERGFTLSFAESCTGGLISSLITSVSGSSAVFSGGIVSYSNEVKKSLLGVLQETLNSHGAVSPHTALEMARGVMESTGADLNAAVTGIAGPGGGSAEKPVGLVYIAVAGRDIFEEVKKFKFKGDRERVRFETVRETIELLLGKLS